MFIMFFSTLTFADTKELKQYKIFKSVKSLAEETFELMDLCFGTVIKAKNGDMTPGQFQTEKNNFIFKINNIRKKKNIVVKYVDKQYNLYNKPFFETYFSFFHVAETIIINMTIHGVDINNYDEYKEYLKSAFWIGKRKLLPFDLHLSELRKIASNDFLIINTKYNKKSKEYKDKLFFCGSPDQKKKVHKELGYVCGNLCREKDRLNYIINDECPNNIKLFRLEGLYKKELVHSMTQQEIIYIKGWPDVAENNLWIYKNINPKSRKWNESLSKLDRYAKVPVETDEYLFFDSYGRFIK